PQIVRNNVNDHSRFRLIDSAEQVRCMFRTLPTGGVQKYQNDVGSCWSDLVETPRYGDQVIVIRSDRVHQHPAVARLSIDDETTARAAGRDSCHCVFGAHLLYDFQAAAARCVISYAPDDTHRKSSIS